ncbi:O-antigen ligase family protein [Hymenobacter sp. BRD67]|uniref:O-antigen ligase family protein n=1 Tax=Hymenobacter sp. BRD67 TaxID=2675877 RepID=UPI00156695AA|nr:O-antigen ligase family protein [Hymenobacter sp. BRD67]QKG53739.1 O-antigen ligase family protein [Hymenobacter sp. BRD67]
MWRFFSEFRVRQLSVYWVGVIIAGLFLTRWVLVLPSIGIAGFTLTALAYALQHKVVAQRRYAPQLLSFVVVYGVHMLAGLLHSSITNQDFQKDLLLQLPLLLLPLAFVLLPSWGTAQKQQVWLILISCCLLSALGATIHYLHHSKEIDALYSRSQVMPTEPDHIRFSLLISISIVAGVDMLLTKGVARSLKVLVAVSITLLFLFQHLLAVRSGLLTVYAAIFTYLGGLLFYQGRWKPSVLGLLAIGAIGGSCLLLFPTLQIRIRNTVFDTQHRHIASAANNFSVTSRIYSYEVAESLLWQHPLLGIGKVALPHAMAQQYSYRYPEISAENYALPHNQFLYNAVSYGLLGLLLFLLGFYYPFWQALREHNIQAVAIYCIISLSFLSEYTLETNIGVIVGVLFMLIALAPVSEAAPRQPI